MVNRKEIKRCPICQSIRKTNYLPSTSRWYCLTCETEFDKNGIIYVYDENGDLVELISSNPKVMELRSLNKINKSVICTITL